MTKSIFNTPLESVVPVRCKNRNLAPDNKEYERKSGKRWVPVTMEQIRRLLDDGFHILWNPRD